MGREIRRVPANWGHPLYYNERTQSIAFTPLMDEYEQRHAEWVAEGSEPEDKPDPTTYMPNGEWYQLYEDVSEGTPLSPPFETQAELADWLSTNPDYWGYRRSQEQAQAMVDAGWAPSGLAIGASFYRAEDAAVIIANIPKEQPS